MRREALPSWDADGVKQYEGRRQELRCKSAIAIAIVVSDLPPSPSFAAALNTNWKFELYSMLSFFDPCLPH